jgi:toxin ParE1/3/4
VTAPLPVFVLPRARQDIADAADHCVDEAGDAVAQRFADALGEAFDLLARNPGIGSLRHASLLALPGMRCWPLRPWPQLIFYVVRERQLDIVRVLHSARDVPAAFAELPPPEA